MNQMLECMDSINDGVIWFARFSLGRLESQSFKPSCESSPNVVDVSFLGFLIFTAAEAVSGVIRQTCRLKTRLFVPSDSVMLTAALATSSGGDVTFFGSTGHDDVTVQRDDDVMTT